MLTLEELRKKHEQHFEREKKELHHKEKVLSLLPEGVVPRFIHASGYRCDVALAFEVENRAQVVEIFDKLPVVRAVKVEDTFISFIPLERTTPKEREKSSITEIEPFIVKTDQVENYPTQFAVEWWTALEEGFIAQVKVEVKHDKAQYRKEHVRDTRGNIIETYWELYHAVQGNYSKFWSSPGTANPVTFYWYLGEIGNLTEALAEYAGPVRWRG